MPRTKEELVEINKLRLPKDEKHFVESFVMKHWKKGESTDQVLADHLNRIGGFTHAISPGHVCNARKRLGIFLRRLNGRPVIVMKKSRRTYTRRNLTGRGPGRPKKVEAQVNSYTFAGLISLAQQLESYAKGIQQRYSGI